jgi:hypothetical protein
MFKIFKSKISGELIGISSRNLNIIDFEFSSGFDMIFSGSRSRCIEYLYELGIDTPNECII